MRVASLAKRRWHMLPWHVRIALGGASALWILSTLNELLWDNAAGLWCISATSTLYGLFVTIIFNRKPAILAVSSISTIFLVGFATSALALGAGCVARIGFKLPVLDASAVSSSVSLGFALISAALTPDCPERNIGTQTSA